MRAANARINAVLCEIKKGDKVADIGCDHGIVANLAVNITGNVVFATDISEPSLQKARLYAEALGQTDKVICRSGDGLEPVENEDVDTVVIAGMGGNEIIRILSRASVRYEKYIFVPHRDAKRLRQYLSDNGYAVKSDTAIVSEGKYYWIIVAEGTGNTKYTPFQLYFGKTENDARTEYVENRRKYLKQLLPLTGGKRKAEISAEIEIIEGTV